MRHVFTGSFHTPFSPFDQINHFFFQVKKTWLSYVILYWMYNTMKQTCDAKTKRFTFCMENQATVGKVQVLRWVIWIAMGNQSDNRLDWNGENYNGAEKTHTFVLLQNKNSSKSHPVIHIWNIFAFTESSEAVQWWFQGKTTYWWRQQIQQ